MVAVCPGVGTSHHGPGLAAVGGAQNSLAIIGIGRIVWVAGAGEHHGRGGRLHGHGADREGWDGARALVGGENRKRVRERSEAGIRQRPGGVRALPNAATCGPEPYGVAGGVVRIDGNGSNAPGHGSVRERAHRHRTQGLPRDAEVGRHGGGPAAAIHEQRRMLTACPAHGLSGGMCLLGICARGGRSSRKESLGAQLRNGRVTQRGPASRLLRVESEAAAKHNPTQHGSGKCPPEPAPRCDPDELGKPKTALACETALRQATSYGKRSGKQAGTSGTGRTSQP